MGALYDGFKNKSPPNISNITKKLRGSAVFDASTVQSINKSNIKHRKIYISCNFSLVWKQKILSIFFSA